MLRRSIRIIAAALLLQALVAVDALAQSCPVGSKTQLSYSTLASIDDMVSDEIRVGRIREITCAMRV